MKRRNFIKAIPATGMIMTAIGTAKAQENGIYFEDKFDLNEVTIAELQNKMKSGRLTSKKITSLYLERIKAIDKSGPAVNAILQLNPDALNIAEQLDNERKQGNIRGPLHGIPVLVKDNINTADKMMTTAGSLALLNHVALRDAFIIKKLREAGAVLLGKTNCSEWSNFRSSRSASGWSSRGGQTKNPCMLDRSPSGSSSGSAVAVATNMCAVAVGTETDGSIVSPSSFNGIVGIKPTVGLWSRSGIIPISKTQDTAGPMARTVSDAATLLGVLCGEDEDDEKTVSGNGKFEKDYTKYLDEEGLKNARIGIEKSFLEGRPGVVDLYKEAIAVLRKKGATIIELDLMKTYYGLEYPEYLTFQYEFKDGLNRYLQTNNTKLKSLGEIIAFNKENEAKVMPFFKQETLESSESRGPLTDKEYVEAIGKRVKVIDMLNSVMKNNNLDAICATSTGLACAIDVINGDYGTGFYFCSPAAVAGFPHITVPMGKVHGLPAGLSFMSTAYKEGDIIRLAYAFESATKKRELPKFIKSSVP
ncbi:MAG: amidase [Chitinophagaceae bacterium]|nr:amidase [Chitinophagaceae bacterium]